MVRLASFIIASCEGRKMLVDGGELARMDAARSKQMHVLVILMRIQVYGSLTNLQMQAQKCLQRFCHEASGSTLGDAFRAVAYRRSQTRSPLRRRNAEDIAHRKECTPDICLERCFPREAVQESLACFVRVARYGCSRSAHVLVPRPHKVEDAVRDGFAAAR
jgi:hypothetical protein